MRRRDFISKAAATPIMFTSISELTPKHLISSLRTGRINFRFVAVCKQHRTADLVIINGAGNFNENEVTGGGTFTYIHPTGTMPSPVHGFGAWEAAKLQKFTLTKSPTVGIEVNGILEIQVNLIGEMPSYAASPALFRIVSRTSGLSLSAGQSEGITIIKSNDVTFEPLPNVGGTIFTISDNFKI
jgi:hypothetical protein